jgi:6-phosphogluconolactonase/glucosamine-6-phosphate isomerase/deaminase
LIRFHKIKQPAEVVDFLIARIDQKLRDNKRVFWLVPGGSAADIAIKVTQRLQQNHDLSKLAVSLTDERYGPINHKDSNWYQLINRGFFLQNAQLLPVLAKDNLETATKRYSNLLNEQLAISDYSLALAGMGADGHIFGIKPHSPAITTNEDVVGYKWDDYTRLTPTINLIQRLDEVVIYAIGTEKHPQLDKIETDLSIDEQPAQLLKVLKRVTIFNDYKGGDK